MAKGKAREKQSLATSISADDPRLHTRADLGGIWIGQQIVVLGRDVTLGDNEAEPIIHVGTVEAIHINAQRVRVVLIREGLRHNITRVIEVTQ